MARYPTYLPTDFVKQDDKARFKSYLDGFKPLGSDYEPTKAAPDLFTEAARIAREKGYDDDAGRVAQAILRTEGALSGEIGDAGKSHGPYQFHEGGMLPAYAKALGMDVRGAAEHARKNPTHAIDWALGGYLGNAIREGQAKGLRGAELATYAQQHGQRSQAPERAGQNYSAMFGGGQPIPAHAPTTIGPREQAIPAHTPVDDKAEFGKYLSSFPELGSDLQMGKERAIPAHEPKDDKQAFGEFLDSFPKLGGDLLGGLGQAIGGLGRGQAETEMGGSGLNIKGGLPRGMSQTAEQQQQELAPYAQAGRQAVAKELEIANLPFEVAASATVGPLAGFATPEQSSQVGLLGLAKNLAQKGPVEGVQEAGRYWREDVGEALPGMKGLAEGLIPAGPSEVKAGIQAAKQIPRLGKEAAGLYFQKTAKVPIGLSVEDVSRKPYAQFVQDIGNIQRQAERIIEPGGEWYLPPTAGRKIVERAIRAADEGVISRQELYGVIDEFYPAEKQLDKPQEIVDYFKGKLKLSGVPEPRQMTEAEFNELMGDLTRKSDQPTGAIQPEREAARANFEQKWQKAYGNEPETVPIVKPEPVITPQPELTMGEARKVAKMSDAELAEYNAGKQAPTPQAAKEPWEMTASDIEARYPNAGATVDGRTVGKTVKNQSSIEASIDNPTALEGIREVPISAFEDSGPPKFYSSSEEARTRQLAEQIQQSGHIDPLIVVDDAQGSPYILEGGHRFDALKILGAKSFPAQVVVDEDAYYKAAKEALASGRSVPPEVLADYPDLAASQAPIKQIASEPPRANESPIRPLAEQAAETSAEEGLQEAVGQMGPPTAGNAANRTLLEMYTKGPSGEGGQGAWDRLGRPWRAFVRATTDRDVDLAQFQKEAQKAKGAPLSADEMAYELNRLNPDKSAEVAIQDSLKPAIQAAGDDRAWLSVYLTHLDNIDVARAMGQKAKAEALQADLPGLAASDLTREKARLRALHDQRQAFSNVPDKLQEVDARIAASRKEITRLERKIQRQKAARTVKAVAIGAQAEARRKFSGGLDVAASRQALADMTRELGPERMQKIEVAARQVQEFVKGRRDRLAEAGVIPTELRDALAEMYPNYVPTRILDYMQEPVNIARGKSLSLSDTGLRRNTIEGTVREREDPLASLVRLAYQSEATARKNEAFNAFVKLREMLPDVQDKIREVADNYVVRRNEAKVTGFVEGKRVTYAVPKELEAVIKAEPGAVIPGFAGDVWGGLMSGFRMATTSRNPLFLSANAMLDMATYVTRASIREGGPQHAPRVLMELGRTYADAFSGLFTREYKGSTAEFLRSGGGMFGFFQGSPGEARRTVQDLSRKSALEIRGVGDLRRIATDLITFKPIEAIGERIELAPRVAQFRLAQKRGANTVQATIQGRTVTMDFAQGGNVAKVLNQFIPFFNVGMQATAQPVRAFAENPRAFVATMGALIAGPTLAAEAWNRSDPQRSKDYDDVPDYIKDQGVVIMLPTEVPTDARGNRRPEFISIRLREFAPFAIATREAASRALGKEPREWQDLLRSGVMSISPIQGNNPADLMSSFTPLVASTGLQLAANQDYFRGRMIATKGGDERASEVSKVLAGVLGVRPSQVEFTIRDLAGGLGATALGAGQLVAGKTEMGGSLQDKPIIGGIAGRFVKSSIGGNLDRAQARLISPQGKQILKDNGIDLSIGPVGNTIEGVPLNVEEQTMYQELTNQYLDEALREIVKLPKWAEYDMDVRADIARGAVDGARDGAGAEVFKKMGNEEIRRRLKALKEAS